MIASSTFASSARGLLLAFLAFGAFAGSPSAVFGAGDSDAWRDPYPLMPPRNDPKFIGAKWRRGPMISDKRLEYLARVPKGDTASLPLIVVGAAGDDALAAHEDLYRDAVVIYIGPTSDAGPARNAWLRTV